MRKAVIDLGTNTFNLLIADVHDHTFDIIHSEKEGVALGMGGINKNVLAPEAYNRGIKTLSHFKNVCEDHGVKEIRGIGTSALRDASNSKLFIDEVNDLLGIHIDVISGDREAELIYQGVRWSYAFSEPSVIMDIGGGSTEFIFADSKGINDMVSFNIGVSRIYQQFEFSDPMSAEDIDKVETWLGERVKDFFRGREEHILVGASGSFETFYELIHNVPFPSEIKAIEISIEHLRDCLDKIIASTQEERDANNWIIPIRKKMAPIAAVKTRWVIDQLDVKRIFISPCSLKEGAFV